MKPRGITEPRKGMMSLVTDNPALAEVMAAKGKGFIKH
jgi:hypothetical protein